MKKPDIDFYDSTSLKSYNLDSIMKYQLSILNKLDFFTKRHSENVANLVCRICEYLHCSKIFTIHATICGYLHDIGKLRIPPEILNKPGKLTDEEYEIIKNHTTYGYEMCMKDIKLRPYADGAYYHHESLNGTGYPQGLTQKDIPYVAQIIRVADEYDAIVTKRQYTTHVNISETLKDLIKDAKPSDYMKTVALDVVRENYKVGKINAKALKALFKVVIDDTLYEISGVMDYINYLKEQINRLEEIEKYDIKMQKAKSEKDKEYYKEGMRLLFNTGENFENYQSVLDEYRTAVLIRENIKDKLYNEIRIIKKLRI